MPYARSNSPLLDDEPFTFGRADLAPMLMQLGAGLIAAGAPTTDPGASQRLMGQALANASSTAMDTRQNRMKNLLLQEKLKTSQEERERRNKLAKGYQALFSPSVATLPEGAPPLTPGQMSLLDDEPVTSPLLGGMTPQQLNILRAMPPEEGLKLLAKNSTLPAPSNVREWSFFNSLSKEDQERFLRMKRADKTIDLGGSVVVPSQATPTLPAATYQKTLRPGEKPEVKGAQARAAAQGTADVKRAEEARASRAAIESQLAPLDRMAQTVNEIIGAPGLEARTGLSSYVPSMFQGDDARNMQAKMEMLKSQVAQNVLQMYRQMSQTGGAVGQVSNYEQQLFQNNLAALDQAQTKEEFVSQMNKIADFVAGSRKRLMDAHRIQFGDAAPASPAPDGWTIQKVD